ncbi:hypothetical protein HY604_04595 [Candidatus Peregrinibacteria bacterium]|nr:hypothetical protein [Candidatus Peregrinibacteria bacterium]
MSDTAFFEQIEQNIASLINEKKLRLAHDRCLNALKNFPTEKRFLKLKEKIESLAEEENEKYIDEQIAKGKDLIDKEKFADAIKTLNPLLKLTKNTGRIEKLIIKSQELYKAKTKAQIEEFTRKEKQRLDTLMAKEPDRLLDELFYLENENQGNQIVLKITAEYRSKFIAKKIKEKSTLLNSNKYDDIDHFISQLKTIDQHDLQIAELEKTIKLRRHSAQVDQQKEHIYESQKQLVTLMQLKKYDKAIKVAEEILSVDSGNAQVQKILKKANSAFFKQTKSESINAILKNQSSLLQEYEKNKQNFLKI